MSMTREEAIKHLHDDWYIENGRLCVDGDKKDAFLEAVGMGIKALRPVSREQVEKVWRGCNNCRTCDSCAYRYIKAEEEPCWSCNTNIYSNYKPEPNRKFCPACGAPMTDEAVQMVMERLEALHGDL